MATDMLEAVQDAELDIQQFYSQALQCERLGLPAGWCNKIGCFLKTRKPRPKALEVSPGFYRLLIAWATRNAGIKGYPLFYTHETLFFDHTPVVAYAESELLIAEEI